VCRLQARRARLQPLRRRGCTWGSEPSPEGRIFRVGPFHPAQRAGSEERDHLRTQTSPSSVSDRLRELREEAEG